MDIEKLFLLIDLKDDKEKEIVKKAIKTNRIDPSLVYFIHKHLKFKNQDLPIYFLDEIIKRLRDKKVTNEQEALIYFARKEEEERKNLGLNEIIERYNTISNTPLSPNERKRISGFQFKYNMDYNLINYALDIAIANDKLGVNYIEGILKKWDKLKIYTMFDLLDWVARGKGWGVEMY